MVNKFLVIDHFSSDVNQLITEAQKIPFSVNTNNEGSFASIHKTRHNKKLIAKIINYVPEGSVQWDTINGSGTYRKTTPKDIQRAKAEIAVHSDNQYNVIALLYLSPEKDCHGGTAFFRHKKTGLDGFYDLKKVENVMDKFNYTLDQLHQALTKDCNNPLAWEKTDSVQMRHNRLLIFNGLFFHSHFFEFTKVTKKTERLSLVFIGECARRDYKGI